MVNPLLAKLAALLFSLFPQLEGLRFLGQETGNFGGFDADVTAFERDGIPGVLLRVQNSSDKIAWWDKRGEWTSSSSWSVYREGNSSDGFSVHLGCSPPYSWGESPSPQTDFSHAGRTMHRPDLSSSSGQCIQGSTASGKASMCGRPFSMSREILKSPPFQAGGFTLMWLFRHGSGQPRERRFGLR